MTASARYVRLDRRPARPVAPRDGDRIWTSLATLLLFDLPPREAALSLRQPFTLSDVFDTPGDCSGGFAVLSQVNVISLGTPKQDQMAGEPWRGFHGRHSRCGG